MNRPDPLHQKQSIKLLYYRYKDSPYYSFSLLFVTISICLLLVWKSVLPQLDHWFSIQREIEVTNKNIQTIRKNIQFIQVLDQVELDKNLALAADGLPSEKEVTGILSALGNAALHASVSLEDYAFTPGDLKVQKDASALNVSLALRGDQHGLIRFMQELKEALPLSEVTQVAYNSNTSSLAIQFRYKPFPSIKYEDTKPITPLTLAQLTLLQTLESWSNAQ